MDDFAGAKFYCPHALADGNQRIRIREKMLEFSSTVLSTLSPNMQFQQFRVKVENNILISPVFIQPTFEGINRTIASTT